VYGNRRRMQGAHSKRFMRWRAITSSGRLRTCMRLGNEANALAWAGYYPKTPARSSQCVQSELDLPESFQIRNAAGIPEAEKPCFRHLFCLVSDIGRARRQTVEFLEPANHSSQCQVLVAQWADSAGGLSRKSENADFEDGLLRKDCIASSPACSPSSRQDPKKATPRRPIGHLNSELAKSTQILCFQFRANRSPANLDTSDTLENCDPYLDSGTGL
jgi:hypothetical protein